MTMHSALNPGIPDAAWVAGALIAVVLAALIGVTYLAAKRSALSCCPHVELGDLLEEAA